MNIASRSPIQGVWAEDGQGSAAGNVGKLEHDVAPEKCASPARSRTPRSRRNRTGAEYSCVPASQVQVIKSSLSWENHRRLDLISGVPVRQRACLAKSHWRPAAIQASIIR